MHLVKIEESPREAHVLHTPTSQLEALPRFAISQNVCFTATAIHERCHSQFTEEEWSLRGKASCAVAMQDPGLLQGAGLTTLLSLPFAALWSGHGRGWGVAGGWSGEKGEENMLTIVHATGCMHLRT